MRALGGGSFIGSLGGEVTYPQRNWYLEGVFDERRLGTIGTIACAVVIGMGIGAAIALTMTFLGSVI